MSLLTRDELDRMERLLAELLPAASDAEEGALLHIHARLQAIYAAQSHLQKSRDRLMALRSQMLR